jgi:hypothetical protein
MSTTARDAALLAKALLLIATGLSLVAVGVVADPVLHRLGIE